MFDFGTWSDPGGALREYLGIREELQAGIDPRKQRVVNGTTVGDLANLWLDQQNAKMQAGDLSPPSFRITALREKGSGCAGVSWGRVANERVARE